MDRYGFIRGKLPKKLFIMICEASASNGSITKSAIEFKNHTVSEVQFRIDGKAMPHSKFFKPNFTNDENFNALREYKAFQEVLGVDGSHSNGLTYNTWSKHACIYGFDLNPDFCNSIHNHPLKIGNLDLNIIFKTAPVATLEVLVYAEYNAVLTITHDKVVEKHII